MAFAEGFVPFIERRGNVTCVGGYCGNGVAMSNYLGRKAALWVLGDPEGETAFARQNCRPWLAASLP